MKKLALALFVFAAPLAAQTPDTVRSNCRPVPIGGGVSYVPEGCNNYSLACILPRNVSPTTMRDGMPVCDREAFQLRDRERVLNRSPFRQFETETGCRVYRVAEFGRMTEVRMVCPRALRIRDDAGRPRN